jgi:hypothetical protein
VTCVGYVRTSPPASSRYNPLVNRGRFSFGGGFPFAPWVIAAIVTAFIRAFAGGTQAAKSLVAVVGCICVLLAWALWRFFARVR